MKLIVAFLCLSLGAIASGKTCPQDCNQGPSSPAGFTLAEATAAFENAVPVSAQELVGTWKAVGQVDFSPDRVTGLQDQYDTTGIKNSDGSYYELRFTGGVDIAGNPVTNVSFLGLGEKDAQQGPYGVQLSDQGACFAQYGYYTSGELDQSSSFSFVCRITSKTQALICAMTYHNSGNRDDGKVVAYNGFVKE